MKKEFHLLISRILIITPLFFISCYKSEESSNEVLTTSDKTSNIVSSDSSINRKNTEYHSDFNLNTEGHSIRDFIPNYCTINKSFGYDFNHDGISDSFAIVSWMAKENEGLNKVFAIWGNPDGDFSLIEDLTPVLYEGRGYNEIELVKDSILILTDLPLYEQHLRKFYLKFQNNHFMIVKIIGDFVENGNSYYSSLELESGIYIFNQTMYTETNKKDTTISGTKSNSTAATVSDFDLTIEHNGKNLDLGNRFNLY